MRSFEVPDTNPPTFVETMRTALAADDYDRYVFIALDGDRLAVELRWMGTTRFDFRLRAVGSGVRAEFLGHRVAPLHRAFSDRFEVYFEKALAKVGARVV